MLATAITTWGRLRRYFTKSPATSENEEQFLSVFEKHAAVMLLVEPPTGAILAANKAAEQFYGYSVAQLRTMNINAINTMAPDQIQTQLKQAVKQDRTFRTFHHRLSSGEIRVVEVYATPIELKTKRVLFVIVHDATRREQATMALRARTEELTALQATLLDITSPQPLPALLHTIVERAARLLNATSGGLYLTEPKHRQVRCVVSYNTPKDYTGILLNYGEGAAGTVAQTGEPLTIEDYRLWSGRAKVFEEEGPFQTVISTPLLWQGKVTGVIHVLRETIGEPFSQENMELLMVFANHAAVAVENARLRGELEQELTERKQAEAEREELISELQTALGEVKQLSGLLPICASCHKIRNDEGYWQDVAIYIRDRSEVEFSHGICPDCMKDLYPEYLPNSHDATDEQV